MTRLSIALLAVALFCGSCSSANDVGTTDSAFTCVRRVGLTCTIWWPGLIPASPTQPIAPAWCTNDASPPPDGYVKVFSSPNLTGQCNLLAPGAYGTLGDWHHAAGTGDGIPEVRVRSMLIGARVSVAVYANPGFGAPMDFWTFSQQIPDMLDQRAGSIATWWQP